MFAQVIIDKINEYSLSDTLYVEGHTNLYFHKRIWAIESVPHILSLARNSGGNNGGLNHPPN